MNRGEGLWWVQERGEGQGKKSLRGPDVCAEGGEIFKAPGSQMVEGSLQNLGKTTMCCPFSRCKSRPDSLLWKRVQREVTSNIARRACRHRSPGKRPDVAL